MENYRDFVNRCALEEDASRGIMNRSADHAAVIMERVFAKAEQRVRILTGCLDRNVYDTPEVIESALGSLRHHPGLTIQILSESLIHWDHPMLDALKKEGFGDRIEIRHLNGIVPNAHFAVSDGRHFRFEGDPKRFEAVVYFGNSELGNKLVIAFDKLWDVSQQSPVAG